MGPPQSLAAGACPIALVAGVVLLSCAGSSPEPTEADDIDLVDDPTPSRPVEADDIAEPEQDTEQPATTVTVERRSPVVLWCADDKGEACQRAALELGVGPRTTASVPKGMLTGIQDLRDDCADPQVSSLARRLSDALGLPMSRWHDHIGNSMSREGLMSIYSAAGCVNCCDAQLPTAKIHAVPGSVEPMYLVRVWEASSP